MFERIAILGGGMGALTAAFELTEDPAWQDKFEGITVYQLGWRLGGKGASSRGANGRIEEHGLHVWLGYYENSFRVVRQVYAELDRANNAPESPLKAWTDAFSPVADVGFEGWATAEVQWAILESAKQRKEIMLSAVMPSAPAADAGNLRDARSICAYGPRATMDRR